MSNTENKYGAKTTLHRYQLDICGEFAFFIGTIYLIFTVN